MSEQLPHISHPLDSARRTVAQASHNIYRAQFQDSAYEIDSAIKKLENALAELHRIQEAYPIAHPSKIDHTKPPTDPSLAPEPAPALPCRVCGGSGWRWNVDAGFPCKVCNPQGLIKPD